MRKLNIDIETYSGADLSRCGAYRYAEDADFEVLLFAYSADGKPVPEEVLDTLADPTVEKWAFNAAFERVCLSRMLADMGRCPGGRYLDPAGWRCTMVWSATLGLPLSLAGAGAALGIGRQKLARGKDLVRFFCQPCAPTKANGGRTRNLPAHDPGRWEAFKVYNARDVEAEMEVESRLSRFPVPQATWDEYRVDQQVNDRGVAVDLALVRQAMRMDERARADAAEAMRRLTGLDNPNSVQQLKAWLADNGLAMESLDKRAVAAAVGQAPPELRRVLELRQRLSKSSVRKYQAM